MKGSPHPQEVLDAIAVLAQQIARAAPECAEQAMQIADLAGSLRPKTDWATVQDAIEAEMLDCDLSDSEINATTEAVVKALGDKGPKGR